MTTHDDPPDRPAPGPLPMVRPRAAENELQMLDAMRLLAALAVVLYHFRGYLSDDVERALGAVSQFHYAVDLFFVISGFVIAYVYSGRLSTVSAYRRFLRRRVARLAPLHWLTLSFYVVVGAALTAGIGASAHLDNYDWGCLVPNALGVHAFGVCDGLSFNFVSWSVSAEMGMYVLAPVILVLGRRSPAVLLAAAAVAVVALSTAGSWAPFLPERSWTAWTYDFGVLRALPAFLFGVALFSYRHTLARIPCARHLVAAASVAFLVVASVAPHPAPLVALAYAIAALGVAADAQGRPGAAAAVLAPSGRLTYGVYMLHPVVLTLVLTLVGERMLRLTGAAMNALVLIALVLTIVLSTLSFRMFESPARRWMSGRSR